MSLSPCLSLSAFSLRLCMADTASGEGESPELRTGVCGEVWHSQQQLVVVSLDTPVIGVQGVEEEVDTAVTEVQEVEE